MGVCQPTEEGRHLTVLFGPDHEVPVVGEDAVGQHADRVTSVRLDDDALKRREVVLRAEQVHPADRSVQDMVDLSARCVACGSWYGMTVAGRRWRVNTRCVPLPIC